MHRWSNRFDQWDINIENETLTMMSSPNPDRVTYCPLDHCHLQKMQNATQRFFTPCMLTCVRTFNPSSHIASGWESVYTWLSRTLWLGLCSSYLQFAGFNAAILKGFLCQPSEQMMPLKLNPCRSCSSKLCEGHCWEVSSRRSVVKVLPFQGL